MYSSTLIWVGGRSMHSCCLAFGKAKTDIKASVPCSNVDVDFETCWWLLHQNSCPAGCAVYKSTLSIKNVGPYELGRGDKRCLWLPHAVMQCDEVTVCAPRRRCLGELDRVPFWSSWTQQRGLLVLGCRRLFKRWSRLQKTNNKPDTVRSRVVRPRADALKWAMRFSSGGIRWGVKRRREVQSSS